MRTPVIVINFKGYNEVCGTKGLEMATVCQEAALENGFSIVIAPQTTDLALMVKTLKVPVFAQTLENVKPGSCRGHITPESVAGCGAVGTLLNHSENRLKLADIDDLVQRAKALQLETIVCTNNIAVTLPGLELPSINHLFPFIHQKT